MATPEPTTILPDENKKVVQDFVQPDPSDDNSETRELYATNVNVFDTIMGSEIVGKRSTDFWHWKRMDVNVPIRSLEGNEFKDLNERFTIRRRVKRSPQVSSELDTIPYNAGVAAIGCLDPNFSDPEIHRGLVEKFGMSKESEPLDLIQRVFHVGEIAMMTLAILELTGFVDDEEAAVENLKG